MNLIRKLLMVLLLLFYVFVLSVVFNPNVSAAYRAYYITHEMDVWIPSP